MTTKNVFTAICLVLLTALNLNSQVLQESFNYPEGDSLGAHGWIHFSPAGAGTLNRLMVTAPGLEYPGYLLPGTGNAAAVGNSGQDVYKALSTITDSGNIYAYFLISVDSVRSTGDYFCAFLPSNSNTGFQCRVYVKRASSGSSNFSFGISKTTTTGGIEWTDTVYNKETTYLTVMKYSFIDLTNTDDEVSLFVFSTGVPAVEPSPALGPLTGSGNDAADIGKFALRQGSETSAPDVKIDEIYSVTEWIGTSPVELNSLHSFVSGRNVSLYWSVAEELNNSRFEIERINSDNSFSGNWTKIGNVPGNGTSSRIRNYSFTDRALSTGKYFYRLKQIDLNGNYEYINLRNEISIGIPAVYSLNQNYPNPFNPVTRINFDLPFQEFVSLKLFDLSGKEVAVLISEETSAGYHSLLYDGSNLPSGVYFYALIAGNFTSVKRMLLVK